MASNKRTSSKFRTRRRLNVRLILCFLGACVVSGGLVHLLHGFQQDKNADALKQRATQLADEGADEDAIRRYRQYVKLRSNDLEAWLALGELLDKTAKTGRQYLAKYLANEQILRLEPTNSAVRRRQAETAMALRRFDDAKQHWRLLQDSAENDGEIEFQLGLCEEFSEQHAQALTWYGRAKDHGYNDPAVFLRIARLQYGPLEKPAQAEATIDEMMAAHPDSAEAYHARAMYRRVFGSAADALADTKEALKRDPDNVAALLLMAELTMADPEITPEALDELLTKLEKRLQDSEAETGNTETSNTETTNTATPDAGASGTETSNTETANTETANTETANTERLQQQKSQREARLYELLARIEVLRGNRQQAITVLQRGLQADAARTELAWQLADLLIAAGQIDDAQQQLEQLRSQQADETPLRYLEARIEMAAGEFVKAKEHLEYVQNRADDASPLSRLSGLQLGACYGRMGQYDKQLDVCKKILKADPQSIEAKLGSAAALEALGQTSEAIKIYQAHQTLPEVSLRLARLLFSRELRRPQDERNWQPVERALSAAEKQAPGSTDVALLNSAIQRAQGGPAQELSLQSLRSDPPTDVRIWIAAAMTAMRNEEWDKSQQILDAAQKQLGDSVTLRLARAAWWSRRDEQQAEPALAALEGSLGDFSKDEQLRLLEGLATVHFLRGDTQAARRLWTAVAKRYPDHVRAQFRLLRLAVGLQDEAEVKNRLQELERIEGDVGPHVLVGKALDQIARARRGEAILLQYPQDLLKQAAGVQKAWAIIPLAQAEIAELAGNLSQALTHYLQAVELDNRDPAVLRRTMALLLSRGRANKAKQLIANLFDSAPVSVRGLLLQLQTEVAIALRDTATAERIIPIAASADTKNFRLQLWRGRMLAAVNQTEPAAAAFKRAVELAPNQPDVWVAQVAFLARRGQTAAAKTAVDEATQRLSGPEKALALARCYEAIGDLKSAEQSYKKQLTGGATTIDHTRMLVEFYLRTAQPKLAEPLVKKLLQRHQKNQTGDNQLTPADLLWARRSLAAATAAEDYRHFRAAVALLDENIKNGEDTIDDQRMKARLLATRPHPEELRDAKRILESLASRNLLQAADQRLLATICERMGEQQQAAAYWSRLAKEQSNQPGYVAQYINRLLRLGDLDDAEPWLKRLEAAEPETLRTVALRARWLVLKQQAEDALQLLQGYADKQAADDQPANNTATSGRLLRLAQVLEQLAAQSEEPAIRDRMLAAAEQMYRQQLSRQPKEKQPALTLQLAMFLSRQDRRDDALDHCEAALETVPLLEVTAAAVVIVRDPAATPAQIARVESWLVDAADEPPAANTATANTTNAIAARVQLAEFRLSHEQYEESARIYQQILEQIPDHIVALNNLAWLLSVWKGDHTAAEKMVQRAIDRAGPIPALLDTRGSIALGRGDTQQAVEDFRKVVAQDSSSAARYHLALAYWKSKNRDAARFNFEKAEQAGLTADDLYPLERNEYEQLRQYLQPAEASTGSR